MPEGEEDISWPWIKEALPSIPLTKVSHFLSFVLHWRFVSWQPCALCRTSLSFPWSWPLTPSAIWHLWTSLKTTYHRCQNNRNVVTLLLPGPWKTSARPGSHLLPGEGKRRGIRLPRPRECCLQHRYLNIFQSVTLYMYLVALVSTFSTKKYLSKSFLSILLQTILSILKLPSCCYDLRQQ